MRKNALKRSCIWLGFAIISFIASGCGDESTIMIDDGGKTVDSPSPAQKTGGTADRSEDGKESGWWPSRKIRGVFKGDGDSAQTQPGNGGAQDMTPVAPDGDYNSAERWSDEQYNLTDPDFIFATERVLEQKYPEAKHTLLNVVSRHPNNTAAWRWLGDCHYNLLELEQAVDAYQKALNIYSENYFALRGLGFSYLHLGHDYWRAGKRQEAHEQYRKSLRTLQDCLRVFPADIEAMYGQSMAAEGASRRLYQNAITQIRAGNRELAEAEMRNCLEVIDAGIESARQRMYKNSDEIGPRSVVGGLFQRRAILQHSFTRLSGAIEDMGQAVRAYQSILEISPDNYLAKGELERCQELLKKWEAEQARSPSQE